MNESFAQHGAGSLHVETSRLSSIAQRWDAGVLAGDRALYRNNVALGLLLAGLCLGLLAFILFMLALYKKNINTRHLTVFRVSLIVSSLLQMLSTPVVAMQLLGTVCSLKYCYTLIVVWFASRRLGVFLHLAVTLELILAWRQLRGGAKTIPLCWSVPVVLSLNLIYILFFNVVEAAVAFGTVTMTLTLCLSTYYTRISMDRRLTKVFCTALFFVCVTYFPSFVVECIILHGKPISGRVYDILLCLTNMRLIVDGYLCWVTCRETEEEAPEQMEAGVVDPPNITQAQA